MTLPLASKLDGLVDEILEAWGEYAAIDKNKRLGETMQGLIQLIASYCRERDWPNAQRCCETACSIFDSGLDQRGGRMDMDAELSRGAVEFYSATTLVGQNKIDVAFSHYQTSSDKFASRFQWMPVAVIWFNVGRIYGFKEEWSKAMWAFQRSLNALDSVGQNLKADELEEKVKVEFLKAKDGLAREFRAPSKPTGKVDETPEETKLGIRKLYIVQKITAGDPKATIDSIVEANLTEENVLDTIKLDTNHLKGAHLGLLVEGQSMIEGGMLDGDYVFIRLGKKAENGDVVAVSINHDGEFETVLKKYFKEDNPRPHHRLQPMNSAIPPIIVVPSDSDSKIIESAYANRRIPVTIMIGEIEVIGRVVALWRNAD